MKRVHLLFIIFPLLSVVRFESEATTLVSLSMEQKFALAERVLEVKVRATSSGWDDEKEKREIRTSVEAELVEAFKGKIPGKNGERKGVQFFLPGGIVGDIGQLVVGTPHIEVGDRFFIFLTSAGEPLGLGDGVYEIQLIEGKERVRQKGGEFEGTEIAGEALVPVERFRKVLRELGQKR
ncbi:MAG: hypothetical protein HY391_02810 [Deltaproteobacteria bacterium]|nr:hypothetical protein [Deltaproteobacteria bacterium]